ncbi:MAG: hypothetical protein WC322_02940 [Candidatus Paceibacterota bacterium]
MIANEWIQPDLTGEGTPGVEPAPEGLSVEGRLLLAEARAEVLERELKAVQEHTFAIVRHITDKEQPPPDRSWVTTELIREAGPAAGWWVGPLTVAILFAFLSVSQLLFGWFPW